MRGGEKVLEVLCELFPNAVLYTLVYNKGTISPVIERMNIRTSFIDRLPAKEKKYRNYLPLMPLAIGSMDFSEYDLIISSSHAVAKGARPGIGALHICYCHTPMRYIWDQFDEYFGRGKTGLLTRTAMNIAAPFLRRWDVQTSGRVHRFVANSHNVAERIKRIYRRESDVIYPPVETGLFRVSDRDDGYFLIVTAMVPYKRIDLAVEAFNRTGDRLLIVGSGPEEEKLKRFAKKNIEFLGWQSNDELVKLYTGCRALIFPGEEDFGIVPLEAMASGKPVIAFGKGGALETVAAEGDFPTGIFFYEKTPAALEEAIKKISRVRFDPYGIRRHAEKFDRQEFKRRISAFISEQISA
jgi:glycosyltransferase involved in cell wall biosynthesis